MLAGAVFGAATSGQGPAYRERWGYLHLEARRDEVRQALAGRDDATHARIATLLREPDAGIPFTPVAKALAHLRGVEADAAFVLRSAISAYVLPEVCDPDGKNEACRTTNVSVFVPFAVPFPGDLTFELLAKNALGQTVWAHTITTLCSERDVRMALPTAMVQTAALPDGAYAMTVRTWIDGKPPREHDPDRTWAFHILRGYQARTEAALQRAIELAPGLSANDRAYCDGAAGQVVRAFHGEAFAVASDAVQDLQRLEQVLANLEQKRAASAGLSGDVSLALPVGRAPLWCRLRRASGDEPRPLVVFVSGTPTYDTTVNRPSAPATRDPLWLAHELAEFGRRERWHVVFVESPGLGVDFAGALREALPLLSQFVATGNRKPLLVCEREAAAIVGLRMQEFRPQLSGLVCVGAGAMPAAALIENGALPVRVNALAGMGEESLQRVLDYVGAQQTAGTWRGDVRWLSDKRPAWPFGLSLLATDVARFAHSVFGD